MQTFISKYLPLILLCVIVVICLITLFKVPENLDSALEKITNAETKIDSSLSIINKQNSYLDSLIVINEGLLKELDTIKINNSHFSTSINEKLKTAQSYLWTIKMNIDKLPKEFEEPK